MEATTDLSARTRVLGFDLQTLIQIGIQAVAILLLFLFSWETGFQSGS